MSDNEALRLADALETPTIQAGAFRHEAAAELRRLAGVEAERNALRAENERLTLNGTHSCHAECQRPVCRLTRERDALLEALRDLVQLEADGRTEYESAIPHWDAARAAIAKAEGGGNG